MSTPLYRQFFCYPNEVNYNDPAQDPVKKSLLQRESPKGSVSGTPNSVIVNDFNIEEELKKAEQNDSNFFKVLSMNFYGRLKSNSVDNPRKKHKHLNVKQNKEKAFSPKISKDETASSYEKSVINKPSLDSQSLIRRSNLASLTTTSQNCSKRLLSTRVNSVRSSVIAIDAKKDDLTCKAMMYKQIPLLLEYLQKTQTNANQPIKPEIIPNNNLLAGSTKDQRTREFYKSANRNPSNRVKASTKADKSIDKEPGRLVGDLYIKKQNLKVKRISSSSKKSGKESRQETEIESLRGSKILSQSFMDTLNSSMENSRSRPNSASKMMHRGRADKKRTSSTKKRSEECSEENLIEAEDYTSKLKPPKKYYHHMVNSQIRENLKLLSRVNSQYSEKDEELLKIDTGFRLSGTAKSKPKKTSIQFERQKSPAAFKIFERIPIALNSKIGNWGAKGTFLTNKDTQTLKIKYATKSKSCHSQDSQDQSKASSVEKLNPENIALSKSYEFKIDMINKTKNKGKCTPEIESDIRKEERISLIQGLYGGPLEKNEKKRGRTFSPGMLEIFGRSNAVDLLEKLLSHKKKTDSSFSTSIPK